MVADFCRPYTGNIKRNVMYRSVIQKYYCNYQNIACRYIFSITWFILTEILFKGKKKRYRNDTRALIKEFVNRYFP